MDRSGPGFPVWAFAGFCAGGVLGFAGGYLLAWTSERGDTAFGLVMATLASGGAAAGGAVVGAVRDILAYLNHRFPPAAGSEADYRDQPFRGLPPAPPFTR